MISIVITAYNVENYIEEAIKSALNQTYKDIEVVVVIDKPTDNTKNIVLSLAKTDNRIVIVDNEENVGAGLSRRYGIEKSKGEYILLLDGDDYLREDFIQSLYNKAVETNADIVSGGIEVLDEDGVRNITLYGEQICEGSDKVTKFWKERIVFMNNKLIRRILHDNVKYCSRRYIEDTPVIIPQLWFANKVAYVDNAGYIYRMQKNSLTHTADKFKDIVFKGLCWCDLINFFNKYDKSIFEIIPIKNYIFNIISIINTMNITPEMVNKYPAEWMELSIRLTNIINIKSIDFK